MYGITNVVELLIYRYNIVICKLRSFFKPLNDEGGAYLIPTTYDPNYMGFDDYFEYICMLVILLALLVI